MKSRRPDLRNPVFVFEPQYLEDMEHNLERLRGKTKWMDVVRRVTTSGRQNADRELFPPDER